MRCDGDGNLWAGMGGGEGNDGVSIYAPDGKMIGKVNTPERVANLFFGGAKRNRLFMCGTPSASRVQVSGFKFRRHFTDPLLPYDARFSRMGCHSLLDRP